MKADPMRVNETRRYCRLDGHVRAVVRVGRGLGERVSRLSFTSMAECLQWLRHLSLVEEHLTCSWKPNLDFKLRHRSSSRSRSSIAMAASNGFF
jgi:hypothetical protein